MVAFAIAVVVGLTSYALTPPASFAAGGYPGPDALPGVPTYGGYLGTIPVGGHSALSWVCGLDAPNATNHSPKDAVASINGQVAALLPISTQFGCASFIVYVSLTNGSNQLAPCGYAYVQVNGGPWILVHLGNNELLISGIKHYRHVGAYFPFFIPTPDQSVENCPPTSTTTSSTSTSTTITTIPGQTTTTALAPTSTTLPGFNTTSSIYNAGSTSTVPQGPGSSPGHTITTITQVVTLISVVVAAGAAAVGAGGFFAGVPESLVEEYTSEIEPGGGLPFGLFPAGGGGTLAEIGEEEVVILSAYTDVPPGGGYPVAGEVADSTISDDYIAFVVARDEEDEELIFLLGADDDIPIGGGAPMTELSPRTGGVDTPDDSAGSGR
jgi:hypothetical protein